MSAVTFIKKKIQPQSCALRKNSQWDTALNKKVAFFCFCWRPLAIILSSRISRAKMIHPAEIGMLQK
jgi:hypothetical protein